MHIIKLEWNGWNNEGKRVGQQQDKNGAFFKEIEVQKSHHSNQISPTSKQSITFIHKQTISSTSKQFLNRTNRFKVDKDITVIPSLQGEWAAMYHRVTLIKYHVTRLHEKCRRMMEKNVSIVPMPALFSHN